MLLHLLLLVLAPSCSDCAINAHLLLLSACLLARMLLQPVLLDTATVRGSAHG